MTREKISNRKSIVKGQCLAERANAIDTIHQVKEENRTLHQLVYDAEDWIK